MKLILALAKYGLLLAKYFLLGGAFFLVFQHYAGFTERQTVTLFFVSLLALELRTKFVPYRLEIEPKWKELLED